MLDGLNGFKIILLTPPYPYVPDLADLTKYSGCISWKSRYKKVGVLPIRKVLVKSNILSVYPSSERNQKDVYIS